MMIERIEAPATVEGGEGLLAIVVRPGLESTPAGCKFVTDPDASLQLGVMWHPRGKVLPPHSHPPRRRVVERTTEVLLVTRGQVRCYVYYEGTQYLAKEVLLNAGDLIMLIAGGHAFQMVTDAEMVEIKQGPYDRITDKELF
jgi:hypothetical protein